MHFRSLFLLETQKKRVNTIINIKNLQGISISIMSMYVYKTDHDEKTNVDFIDLLTAFYALKLLQLLKKDQR